MHPETKK